jgi:sensor histidine kinase YesM
LRKFAELLRYQLYECNEDKIPIEKETEYLESYVDLQRLRKDSNNTIRFCKAETVSGFRIAPLLLLPFVENAFKHLSHHTNDGNYIDLNLERTNGTLIFSATNSTSRGGNHKPPGIGLTNVKRRLDLLYENKYRLKINEAEDRFSIKLELDI